MTRTSSDRGFIAVLAILIFLGLIVLLIVLFVVRIDNMASGGDPSKSSFSDESPIKPMIQNAREQKERLEGKIQAWKAEKNQSRNSPTPNETEGTHF